MANWEIAMRYRAETIQLQRGSQTLAIGFEPNGAARYVGRIDGRACVSSPTREGALSALLRRIAYEERRAEYAA